MKIYRLSTVLFIPFVLIGLLILFYSANYSRDYSIWILAPTICIAIIYVFKTDIDNWWLDRNPPILTTKMIAWLKQYSVYYQSLEVDKQKIFEREMSVFIETNQYYIVGKEAEPVPYDIKGIVAHEAIKLILALGKNPFANLNRIVLYKHAFPSPEHQYLHTVEAHSGDGVVIFSLEHLIPGLLSPLKYYNIAMHGYLEVASDKPLNNYIKDSSDISWQSLSQISGLSESFVKATIGLKDINKATIAANYFLNYPLKTKLHLSELSQKLQSLFKETSS